MSTSAHSECGTLVIHVDMRSLPVKRATKAGTVTERYPADRRVPCRPECREPDDCSRGHARWRKLTVCQKYRVSHSHTYGAVLRFTRTHAKLANCLNLSKP